MVLGDVAKYARVARELEQSPWIANRLDELMSLDEKEFNYWLDWVAWNRRQGNPPGSFPPPPSG